MTMTGLGNAGACARILLVEWCGNEYVVRTATDNKWASPPRGLCFGLSMEASDERTQIKRRLQGRPTSLSRAKERATFERKRSGPGNVQRDSAVRGERYSNYSDFMRGLHKMLNLEESDNHIEERTLRLFWRRTEGVFASVRDIVVKVLQNRSQPPINETVLRFVLFPDLPRDVVCKIPLEIIEYVAALVETSGFRFLQNIRVGHLTDERVQLSKRLEHIQKIASRESVTSHGDLQSDGVRTTSASSPLQPEEKPRLFLPLVSEDVRDKLPVFVKEFIVKNLPRRMSIAFDDTIALWLLNIEAPEQMCLLLQRVLDYLERNEDKIPKRCGMTERILYALEATSEETIENILSQPGDAFYPTARLQWFRPRPVTDEEWIQWCEILDRDCDTWLRALCQELDPANEVTEDELREYFESLQPPFLAEALRNESDRTIALQAGNSVPATAALAGESWSCVLHDDENRPIEVLVRAPFLDAGRLDEERARFPQMLFAQGREHVDRDWLIRIFGAASVVFVLMPTRDVVKESRSRFADLFDELTSTDSALKVPIPQRARMLLIVPANERVLTLNPDLRRYAPGPQVLLASRVRIET